MTRRKDQPRIRGVDPADRLIPDWYEKVFVRWAIRRPYRFRTYWATVARVLRFVREPMVIDEMLLHEATVALLPDPEIDNLKPWVAAEDQVPDPAAPPPTPTFMGDLERLLVAKGVAPMDAERWAPYGASLGLALPAGEEVEELRLELLRQIEPILRDLVRTDPDIPRRVLAQQKKERNQARRAAQTST